MKKIRIMLLSLAVLAVVGGALAFKAKGSLQLCTSLPINGVCPANQTCPNFVGATTVQPTIWVCTTTTNGAGIGQDKCTYKDANNQVQSLTCAGHATTTLKID